VSSSSSVRNRSLYTLLDESFAVLRHEVPEAYRRMCLELEGNAVVITVDDEAVIVASDGVAMHVETVSAATRTSAEIRTSRQAILRVLDGETGLADAVLSNAVSARASLETLVQLNRGLAMYVHGAVRAPSFPGLLDRFRRGKPRPRLPRQSRRR
jgi:hypothetical protein